MRRKQPRPKNKNQNTSVLDAEIVRELSAALDPNLSKEELPKIPAPRVVLVHCVERPERPGWPTPQANTRYEPSARSGWN